MDSQENFQGFYRVENCFALHLSVFIPFYIRRRRLFHPKSLAKQMNVLRMICRWTGVCHVSDSTMKATWTTCWRWKLIYYTSGVLLTIIVRKKKYSGIMSFSGKKKWSLSSWHVTNGKTEVHSSGHDTIWKCAWRFWLKVLCSLESWVG